MFTGIVEELGTVDGRDGDRFTFGARLVVEDAKIGDSIAVNGCCLTVVEVDDASWQADVVDETRSRTNLGALRVGEVVNFERPVRVTDRLGGHIVQGHVDAVGEVVAPAPSLQVRVPSALTRYIVEKGSIAVDGCSLTVAAVVDDRFTVAIIPHTAAVTTLGRKSVGDTVNVEVDMLAKYVERLMQGRMEP